MGKQTLEERLELYLSEKGSKNASSSKLLLTASAVAGVGAILVPPPAEAAIVYSQAQTNENEVNSVSTTQTVDFDKDGTEDFVFFWSVNENTNYQFVEKATGSMNVMSTNGYPKKMTIFLVIILLQ